MANFGSNQITNKTFACMSCGQQIKLQRKDDDSGWNRYNLDGTPHVDQKKSFPSSKTLEKLEVLERKLDTLLNEVNRLHQDLGKQK
jgi:hypothetical protein